MLKIKYNGGGTIDHLKKCYGFKIIQTNKGMFLSVKNEKGNDCIRITPEDRIEIYDLNGVHIFYKLLEEGLVEKVGE